MSQSAWDRPGPPNALHSLRWRRRVLVLAALLGCVAVFALARWLADTPMVDVRWNTNGDGALVLRDNLAQQQPPPGAAAAPHPSVVEAIGLAGQPSMPVGRALLLRSPRWQIDGLQRDAQIRQHEALATLLARADSGAGSPVLHLQGGTELQLPSARRGYSRLGLAFWPLAGLALLLHLSAMVVLLTQPGLPGVLFTVISVFQAGTLLLIAIQSMPGLGLPPGVYAMQLPLRALFDLGTGAATVHGLALFPRELARRHGIAAAAWAAAGGVLLFVARAHAETSPAVHAAVWWVLQGTCIGLGAAALATARRSFRVEGGPQTRVLRRFAAAVLATLVLVSLSVVVAQHGPGFTADAAADVSTGASVAWHLFIASLLLLLPFLTRTQPLLREFALLAGVSTVAASFDLLFVAVFSLSPFASFALAVFLALALYAGARQWALDRVLGARVLSTERAFDHVYRTARALQARPPQYPALLVQLLRDLYEPLEVLHSARVPRESRVIEGGSTLVVPQRPPAGGEAEGALLLRFARRGQRLFTTEDARLADRVLEHLRRAVAYDEAVERGRSEERLRIAQDLHDDIGARLLTLMYRAPNREMEDYLRHTLQDLKTLTRGLATAEHRLSHAGAEWKADLSQRLAAAGATLHWHFAIEHDLTLSMAQWSALTRMLRELVSNALHHGRASVVAVSVELLGDVLTLEVADDGDGRAPASWAHGLGLGGVRKRARTLSGKVARHERQPRGIVCSVRVPGFGGPVGTDA